MLIFLWCRYADDTISVMEADPSQLKIMKQALQDFSISTGLSVKFNKYCMLLINISDDEVKSLAEGFGCMVASFPFTYLGLPMGTTRPNLIIRGRSQSLAAWDMVCRPQRSGGLGILDFRKQNERLLMKQLHKFFNIEDIPWVNLAWQYYPYGVPQVANLYGSFWWRDIMKLVDKYREFCLVQVHSGEAALFLKDSWNDSALFCEFSGLFSFALDGNLSVRDVINSEDRLQLFYLPMSQQAYTSRKTVTRGAGPCATDYHATGNTLAVTQVSRCATGNKLAVAHAYNKKMPPPSGGRARGQSSVCGQAP